MPKTPKAANGHDHDFAIIDMDPKDNWWSGNTMLGGILGETFHDHWIDVFIDVDRKTFEITFGPGGPDRHIHDKITGPISQFAELTGQKLQ